MDINTFKLKVKVSPFLYTTTRASAFYFIKYLKIPTPGWVRKDSLRASYMGRKPLLVPHVLHDVLEYVGMVRM